MINKIQHKSIKVGARLLDAIHYPFNSCIILAYHRIGNSVDSLHDLTVTLSHFKSQMQILKDHYTVLNIDQLSASLKSGHLPQRSVVITFDDGYVDNLHFALPVIENLELPVTIYVTAGYIDYPGHFWWDQVARQLSKSNSDPAVVQASFNTLKYCNSIQRTKLLAECSAQYGTLPASEEDRAVSTSELRTLAKSPFITIGSHSMSHPVFAMETPEQQWAELTRSRHLLETLIDKPVTHFALPFGEFKDFTGKTTALIRKAGYFTAVTTNRGPVFARSNPHLLRRYLVRDWDCETFARTLENGFKWR